MIGFIKKMSVRASARQITKETVGLMHSLLPHEEQLLASIATEKDTISNEIGASLSSAASDPTVVAACKQLAWALNGPLPPEVVREDLFKPILSLGTPDQLPGCVISAIFSDVTAIARQSRDREIGGIEAVWNAVKPEFLPDTSEDAQLADERFSAI